MATTTARGRRSVCNGDGDGDGDGGDGDGNGDGDGDGDGDSYGGVMVVNKLVWCCADGSKTRSGQNGQ